MYCIEDLPEEILEFILGYLPPYQDLHNCMLVSKRWGKCIKNVVKTKKRNLYRAICEFDVAWTSVPAGTPPTICGRYSHNAVVSGNSMFVFGGRTSSSTTFNDLWRLDLSTRKWVRPIAAGDYPSPKAGCSMVEHNGKIILFGGWSYPSTYPIHQLNLHFDELHIYDIALNRWERIISLVSPPPVAAHTATIHRDKMIVFGGLQKPSELVHSVHSNELWVLTMTDYTWSKVNIPENQCPPKRYGHSQIFLDEDNLLIIGGCSSPSIHYDDVWHLDMTSQPWRWTKINVRNLQNGPISFWCNPFCRVDDRVVAFFRKRTAMDLPKSSVARFHQYGPMNRPAANHDAMSVHYLRRVNRIDNADRPVDRDENVNGRRGSFRVYAHEWKNNNIDDNNGGNVGPGPSRSRRLTSDRENQRLMALQRAQEKINHAHHNRIKCAYRDITPHVSFLGMYALDISHVLDEDEPYVEWGYESMPLNSDGLPVYSTDGPDDRVLFSLAVGKSELILFGGVERDVSSVEAPKSDSSNALYFVTAPPYVI